MSQIKNLIRNYKYNRESAGNDTVENQSPTLVTEDQFNTVKNFIDSNQATVDKILSIDESTLSDERLSRVKAIKMVMENKGSYEKYLNNNVGNQESANQVYRIEEKNTSEAVGLANYELDHDTKQKTALIDRVKNLRNLKSNPEVAFSSIQQLQLEVAERLLGPQTVAAEFDSKENIFKNLEISKEPWSGTPNDLESRDNRRKNKIDGVNGPATKGEMPLNISGEGFVANLEAVPLGKEKVKELRENLNAQEDLINERFYIADQKLAGFKEILDIASKKLEPFYSSEDFPIGLRKEYDIAFQNYSSRRQAIPLAQNILNKLSMSGNESPTQGQIDQMIKEEPFSATHQNVREIVSSYIYNNPYSSEVRKNNIDETFKQERVQNRLDRASEK